MIVARALRGCQRGASVRLGARQNARGLANARDHIATMLPAGFMPPRPLAACRVPACFCSPDRWPLSFTPCVMSRKVSRWSIGQQADFLYICISAPHPRFRTH
ncbi:hypothetical protein AMAG_17925 [Allomyces macrogynus ATCC 38327]|uniref:Uncharacterized protein n=1 Tax=Allomyces macrogynus (strain ATCC 38327) TaxID=578462 RepID=A0A0L0S2A7_ALLM3|nr:hypothetical protein AMAG_17925 [Allomyces macrogynus ATCC 38327]|eukprot:KNE56484.1 hypothetical protein AMAG_17925 [Allomyces macrogynus ATCC 38327]